LFSVTGFGQKTGREWKCSKTKKETGINLVSGEKVYEVSSCSYQRAGLNEETCGVKGIWFEVYIIQRIYINKLLLQYQ